MPGYSRSCRPSIKNDSSAILRRGKRFVPRDPSGQEKLAGEAPTPTGFAEVTADDFPLLHCSARPSFDSEMADAGLHVSHFALSWQSFWKRGSFRSGSNIGSNWSSAGVSGTFAALSGLSYGV